MNLSIVFECSKTGKAFGVLLEKSDKYRIAQIDKASEGTGEYESLTLTDDEVDFSGFYCPCCGSENGFIKCGKCNELVCGATTREVAVGMEFKRICGYFGIIKPGDGIGSYTATQGSARLGTSTPLLLGD